MVISRDILVAPTDLFINRKSTGWPLFFVTTIVDAVPGLLLLLLASWNLKLITATTPGLRKEEDIWETK